MKSIQSLFKTWMVLTSVFIGFSVILVAGILSLRLNRFEGELRAAKIQLLEIQTQKSLRAISDEMYLHMDTIELHQQELQKMLSQSGTVDLRFLPEAQGQSSECATSASSSDHLLKFDVTFGDLKLGNLCESITWTRTSWFSNITHIVPSVLVASMLLILSWFLVFMFLRRRVFVPALSRYVSLQKSSAVASLTQMLAHDVRRPFVVLQTTIDLLASIEDKDDIKEIIGLALPDIRQNIASANGMIDDVLEIERSSEHFKESVNLVTVLKATVKDLAIQYPDLKTQFEYRIGDNDSLNVDVGRFHRVVSNIVANAIQAMNKEGRVVFSRREIEIKGRTFVELAISNSGKGIPEGEREQIFERFYSKDKPGGTGLGLAIARKIVTESGGSICCSHVDGFGPSFVMNFPV